MATYSRRTPKDSLPKALQPFTFHGMEFEDAGTDQGLAVCPFCTKKKFYIGLTKDDPVAHCKVCGRYNPTTFIRKLWDEAKYDVEEAKALVKERGLVDHRVMEDWGLRKSPLEDTWILPAWNGVHDLVNLYRYAEVEGKLRFMGTPTLKHGLFGPVEQPKKPERVWVSEGPWDGMGWQQAITSTKRTPDGDMVFTGNRANSVGAKHAVYAVPGVNAWMDNWQEKFAGVVTCLMFDNDHPDQQNRCAGLEGTKAAVSRLAFAAVAPKEQWWLCWGDEEKGYAEDMPNGYDVRDVLKATGDKPADRVDGVQWVYDHMRVVPDKWMQARPKKGVANGSADPLPCTDWKTLVNQWRKAMQWPASGTGLDHGLAFMLAVAVSTMQAGDQLWGKVLGPASCGKSTLAEAMSVARQFVHPVSTITGFHSGYKSEDGKDYSLTNASNTKTLIIKDGDTLMKQGNVEQILSEMRDIYDRVSRTAYRNGVSHQYEDLSMTVLVCGTASLVSLDQSELGERFLNCVIMDGINLDNERMVLLRVALGVVRNIDKDVRDKDDQDDPEKLKAKRMTAGYVIHLRENAKRLLNKVKEGVSDATLEKLADLGRFVACLRARPSSKQSETTEREFGARLTSQLTRLALCLSVVLNEPTITPNVLRRVERVAKDTARGTTQEIIADLMQFKEKGSKSAAIATRLTRKSGDVRTLLDFLRHIRVLETHLPPLHPGVNSTTPHWRVQRWFAELYTRVTAMEAGS